MAALRGDLRPHSVELETALEESGGNLPRGDVCFILGDVPRGVSFWGDLDAGEMLMASYYLPIEEPLFAEGVVDDPRYAALLDSIGLGRDWSEMLKARVMELEPVTGISLLD